MRKIFFAAMLLFASSAWAEPSEHAINISGEGVIIDLNINTRDKILAKAKGNDQNKYNAVLQIITKKFNLGKDAIKSSFVYSNPVYVYCDQRQPSCDTTKIDYYDLNRRIEFKLDDLTKYDAIIDALSQNKLVVSTGQYDISEKTKLKLNDQARDSAIDSARAKAEKIAKKLGVKLGKPISFQSYNDGRNFQQVPQPVAMTVESTRDASYAPTDSRTLGKITVSVTVNIAYQIE
jgi:uncharacterized protein YggE